MEDSTHTHSSTNDITKLEDYLIPGLPASFYYIPNFITAEEEAYLLTKIHSSRYINLTHRRLQVYPTQLTPQNVLLSATTMPSWLTNPICQRFDTLKVFEGTKHGTPNHCLINEYEAGQGIMPHEDGGAYASVVATVSLGAPIVLDLWEKDTDEQGHQKGRGRPKYRILQEERSLLVTKGDAYEILLHGISERLKDVGLKSGTSGELHENECEEPAENWELLGDKERFEDGLLERDTRVSLTFRDVLKVSKVGQKLFGKR